MVRPRPATDGWDRSVRTRAGQRLRTTGELSWMREARTLRSNRGPAGDTRSTTSHLASERSESALQTHGQSETGAPRVTAAAYAAALSVNASAAPSR